MVARRSDREVVRTGPEDHRSPATSEFPHELHALKATKPCRDVPGQDLGQDGLFPSFQIERADLGDDRRARSRSSAARRKLEPLGIERRSNDQHRGDQEGHDRPRSIHLV